jgi:copper chaperone
MRFIVENMHCGGCAKGVIAAVKKADPLAQVEVRLEDRSILVSGGRLGDEALRNALRATGWKAAGATA